MKLGVVQGRLSRPVNNHIQQFPDDWEKEFEVIDQIGLTHIEWLITAESFDHVLTLEPKKYAHKITSIGCDNLTNENIGSKDFLDDQLEPICQFAIKNDIKSITIPLLEKSKIDGFVDTFIKNIITYGDKYPTIKFNFELESPKEVAADLCMAHQRFFLTYDIGNITACKYNHEEYITQCSEFIDTVHLKDKSINPVANVEPGTGDADFDLIFNILAIIGFDQERDLGSIDKFTLQTSRGHTGDEINTVQKHKKFFEELYKTYW